MDRLAAHVIATAALTVTLATVPVLFADASHAAQLPPNPRAALAATPSALSPAQALDARTAITALPALPALAGRAQTPAPAAAPETAPPAAAAPAPGAARAVAALPLPRGPRRVRRGAACADARQVGKTARALFRGKVAFSVKEFYSPSCRSFYGYTYAWRQFRALHVRYDVAVAVYDARHDSIDGARTFLGGKGGPGFWSTAVPAAAGGCAQAEGHYFYYPRGAAYGFEEGDTLTQAVCAA